MNRAICMSVVVAAATVPLIGQSSGTPAAPSTISACVGNITGVPRLVPNSTYCMQGLETFKTWNVQGPAGTQGPQGLMGLPGMQGPAGAPGSPGQMGPTGTPGAVGLPGSTGATGAMGTPGATGAAGPMGIPGLAGPAGPVGATGATGAMGATGSPGPIGPIGPMGATGTPGATGAMGPVGPIGPAGITGAPGAIGASGAVGPVGLTGAAGPAGAVGPYGAPGPTGPTGPTGPQGILSTNGFVTAASFNVSSATTGSFYFDPSMPPSLSSSESAPTAANNFFVVPASCTLSSLKVGGTATSSSPGVYLAIDTFEVFVNEVDTGMACLINGGSYNGAFSCSNNTGSVHLLTADRLSLRFTPGGNAQNMRFSTTLACQ